MYRSFLMYQYIQSVTNISGLGFIFDSNSWQVSLSVLCPLVYNSYTHERILFKLGSSVHLKKLPGKGQGHS